MSYHFKVQGSSGVYEVSVDKKGSNLIATCTCSAAENGMACKHRLQLLQGKGDDVIENKTAVAFMPAFIADTVEGQMLKDYITKEQMIEQLKKEVASLKKNLSKLLPI